jgi:peroxiredoxin
VQDSQVPDVILKTRVRDESLEGPNPFRWQDVRTGALFASQRAAVFSLPGAFTPTCTTSQCPAFELAYDDLCNAGVDEVYCMSVNDAFVMYQWGQHLNLKRVKLLPDGSGDFTRRMGMLVNKENFGFGYRSWRYAMIVDHGVIEKLFMEPGIDGGTDDEDPYGETTPERILDYLRRGPVQRIAPGFHPERAEIRQQVPQ